jgi:colanic acid/amylovoran biosynthesis protein
MLFVLMGFEFESPNKGCEALSYSFVSLLRKMFEGTKIEIHNVSYKLSLGAFPSEYPDIKFVEHKVNLKNPKYHIEMMRLFKRADAIFDITYGDSFSDIYDKKWVIKTNWNKQLAVLSDTPLLLMPQTYGPYYDKIIKKWSMSIIKKSNYVSSRDQLSAEYIKKECGRDVSVTTDLAMSLPFDINKYNLVTSKIKIGLNVSSLLWEGGFTKNNQFGLKVDYIKYNRYLIKELLSSGQYDIHLISHVIEDKPNARENDLRACRAINAEFPEVIIAPAFKTPIEAKSYIYHMDVFIGARMHSTIAAFSSGVATIPFSYSRKFEGLFGSLDYPYIIEGTKNDTDTAVKQTMQWIYDKDQLKAEVDLTMGKIKLKLMDFEREIRGLIKSSGC